MNIPVLTYGGSVIVRPGTGWERYNRDFYAPDFVASISGSIVLAATVCKPGKCISTKFARRYYDHVGAGVLLYPDNMIDRCGESYAEAICIDHTAFIPYPEKDAAFVPSLDLSLSVSSSVITRTSVSDPLSIINDAFEKISSRCLVRTGDLIAVELTSRLHMCSHGDNATIVELISLPFLGVVRFRIIS